MSHNQTPPFRPKKTITIRNGQIVHEVDVTHYSPTSHTDWIAVGQKIFNLVGNGEDQGVYYAAWKGWSSTNTWDCSARWAMFINAAGDIYRPMPKDPADARTAIELLDASKTIQEQRAKDYGQPGGERSMQAVAAMFNAATGKTLSDSDCWLIMVCLKIVRDQATIGHQDSVLDGTNYMSLYGESRLAKSKRAATAGAYTEPWAAAEPTIPAKQKPARLPRRDVMLTVLRQIKEARGSELVRKLLREYGQCEKVADVDDDLVDVVIFHANRIQNSNELTDLVDGICQSVMRRGRMHELLIKVAKAKGSVKADELVLLHAGVSNVYAISDSHVERVSMACECTLFQKAI